MNEFPSLLDAITACPQGGALATLVHVAGSSYRRAGARLWIGADGTRLGSVSGGCLEADLAIRAQTCLSSGRAEVITYDTTGENDLVWGVGTGCHGVVRILLERLPTAPAWVSTLAANLKRREPTALAVTWESGDPQRLGTRLAMDHVPSTGDRVFRETIQAPLPLVIFGAGDDARPLVRFAKDLGWDVTVADGRSTYATPNRFPEADRVVTIRCEDDLDAQGVPLDPRTAVVVMTHHYVHDRPLLRHLLDRPLAYLGLLGPRQRADKILADLAATEPAPTPAGRNRLHAPVGLDLGGDSPAEVALSIVSEIQATFAGRDARPLRRREAPIHSG